MIDETEFCGRGDRVTRSAGSARAVIAAGAVLAALMLGLTVHPVPAAEEGTVTAMSAWQGQGRFFQVGPDQAYFVGGFSGIMFVQDDKNGTLDAAKIVCPGTLDISLTQGAQSGEGRCVITAKAGDRVFARWTCSGALLAGCAGTFTLTDGTGGFAGITGEGDFVVRSAIAELAATATGDGIQEQSAGLAIWPDLKYSIP